MERRCNIVVGYVRTNSNNRTMAWFETDPSSTSGAAVIYNAYWYSDNKETSRFVASSVDF